jgi:Group II intron, maturase-specific domain
MALARQRIGELTDRRRLQLPVEHVVQDVNRFLRSWVGYFLYGNSAQAFDKVTLHALVRVGGFVTKHHKQRSGYG